ncbi:unnamed protein product [Rotaria socialis]|uniref:Uncharacterized protein n=1 Tax=Rotaria socialis TaxID=392032 RepID=A0A818S1B7_9BILA|nr:unnamed protein product [Rotaria socialis]CAF4751767.1 unnamed protein product [Rotaria socialis]
MSNLEYYWGDASVENNQYDSSEMETDSSEIACESNDEEEHMLIQLDDESDKVKLQAGNQLIFQLEQFNRQSTASVPLTPLADGTNSLKATGSIVLDNNVFIISLIGDTKNGKSFLTNHLLPFTAMSHPFVLDEEQGGGSTTANVNCYESILSISVPHASSFLLLDFEGEKGSWIPYMLRRLRKVWTAERSEKRRKAVEEYFPKLAYTLSNVIILLSRDDFSNHDYIERCYDFATRATKKLQHIPHKPILILVHNFYTGSKVGNYEELTKEFFTIHKGDAIKLRCFFEAVFCVRLPVKMKHIPTASQTVASNTCFTSQIDELNALLAKIQNKHMERCMPHSKWLELTKLILDIVSDGKAVMMHTLLRQVIVKDPGDIEKITIRLLFNILYNIIDIHSIHWFCFCRKFAMQMLARTIAIRLVSNASFINQNHIQEIVTREECRLCLEKMWQWLDEFYPCDALYMGSGYVEKQNRPVFCFQHKGSHHEHRTSEEASGVPLLSISIIKIRRFWNIYDTWQGGFETNNKTSQTLTEDIHRKFFEKTKSYLNAIRNSEHALYTTFNELLEQVGPKVLPYPTDTNIDMYCLLEFE